MPYQLPPDQNAMGGVFGVQDLPPWFPLVQAQREKRTQTVDGKTFDQAIAEMYDTVQHIRNAGAGFGLNVNPSAFNAWAADGPLSPNIEDRRKEHTLRQKTEDRMLRLGR